MSDAGPLIKAIINNIEEWEEKEVKDCLKDLEKAIIHLLSIFNLMVFSLASFSDLACTKNFSFTTH